MTKIKYLVTTISYSLISLELGTYIGNIFYSHRHKYIIITSYDYNTISTIFLPHAWKLKW